MTRKETIIIAVMVNLGVLAVLLLTARTEIESNSLGFSEIAFKDESLQSNLKTEERKNDSFIFADNQPAPVAEQLKLQEIPYLEDEDQFNDYDQDVIALESTETKPAPAEKSDHFEIKVKRGDFLQKIAKANGTTVEEIKKFNNLTSEKLAVGQVLKIPSPTKTKAAANKTPVKTSSDAIVADGDGVYYTIKSGDNPWKIAKQFHLRVDELVKLNNLDEDKARNLKVGDKIRVR